MFNTIAFVGLTMTHNFKTLTKPVHVGGVIISRATVGHSLTLARLVDNASYGLIPYGWERMAKRGETAIDVGTNLVREGEGADSWCNGLIIMNENQEILGGSMGSGKKYTAWEADRAEIPEVLTALLELEQKVLCYPWDDDLDDGQRSKLFYIGILSVIEGHRNNGYGGVLIDHMIKEAKAQGYQGAVLLCHDENNAFHLYDRKGFKVYKKVPIVKAGWEGPGKNWLVMVLLFQD